MGGKQIRISRYSKAALLILMGFRPSSILQVDDNIHVYFPRDRELEGVLDRHERVRQTLERMARGESDIDEQLLIKAGE